VRTLERLSKAKFLRHPPWQEKKIREAELPEGIIIGAVVRGDDVILPRGDTVTQVKDKVVLFAPADAVKAVERLFAVRLEFF